MAIYHFSAQIIKRSDGRSSVAAAAYRAAAVLLDERTGTAHDFTKKRGVFHSEIMLPVGAPAAFSDRATLWNAVEKKETRKNSQTAREIDFALPAELSHEQKKALAIDFIKANFVDAGMCADVALHDFESDNPHAHVMLTTREVDANGFTTKNRDWNDRDMLKKWREQWQEHANAALEKAGFDARIDHRTLIAQGITDRAPQVHLGAARHAMLKKGKRVDSIEPQLERQQLKRAAQQAANDKIKDAQLYAQSESIQNELEQLEQQLHAERERAHEQRQLEARISAVRDAIAAENAEQQRLTDSITRAQSEHQQLAAKVAELEQYIAFTTNEIRARKAKNITAQDYLRATKEHIQQAQAEQQRLEQSIRDAKQRLESSTKPDLVQLLSDYIKSGLSLNTADYDNNTYLFMRDLLDFYEIKQLSDSELRQLVDSSITSLDALIDDLVTTQNKNNINPSQRF